MTTRDMVMAAAGSSSVVAGTDWSAQLQGLQINFSTQVDVATAPSTNDVYICTTVSVSSTYHLYLAKYDASGTFQWQRRINTGSDNSYGYRLVVGKSGNVYVVGNYNISAVSSAYIVKVSPTGSIIWQRCFLGASTTDGRRANGITIDDNDNLYIVCNRNWQSGPTYYNSPFIAKIDSSGTLVWQKGADSLQIYQPVNICRDSSGNLYIAGFDRSSKMFVEKYNSSGDIQWSLAITRSAYTPYAISCACDSTGNVYLLGIDQDSIRDLYIAKINASGSIVWQKRTEGTYPDFSNSYTGGITVDALDNIYVCSTYYDSGNTKKNALLIKLDSSGTQVWAKQFTYTTSGTTTSGWNVAIDSYGKLVVTGWTQSKLFVTRIPTNGSKTGTYNSLSYTSYSPTYQTPALTSALTTGTNNTKSYSYNVPSYSFVTPTYTNVTTQM